MHGRPDRLSLLERVAEVLREAGTPFSLIGASAMAAHGVLRSTVDQDLLVVDSSCLKPDFWSRLADEGVDVEVRKGDLYDPLAGVVRFTVPGERPLDVVVGKFTWQKRIIERAVAAPGSSVPVVRAADLILLKLYAGGPQDAWDVQQLLAGKDREALIREVEAEIPQLPSDRHALWQKILAG